MALTREGKIILDDGYVASSNVVNIMVVEEISKEPLEQEVETVHTISCKEEDQHVRCCATITFIDEDLLLRSKPHNRPLFVSSFMKEQKVNRVLIDGGSASILCLSLP